MIERNCFLCGSEYKRNIELDENSSKTGKYVICCDCGLIYHNPVASADEFAVYYKNEFAKSYKDSVGIQDSVAEERLEFLIKQGFELKSPVLEIGCSFGSFLNKVAEKNIEVFGVEPSEKLVSEANRIYGLSVFNGTYEEYTPKKNFYSMISLFHVLEHMVNPVETLIRIKEELAPDGFLYLEVPTFREHQLSMVFKNIHPTVFTQCTLEKLLGKTGFRINSISFSASNIRVIATPSSEVQNGKNCRADEILRDLEVYIKGRKECTKLIKERLSLLGKNEGVAIYGAGHTTIELAEIFDLKSINVTNIFDADPEKEGKELLSMKIENKDRIDYFNGKYIIIASYAFQEEIAESLRHLKQRGIELITLYNKA